jgi:hypothetical protein
MTKTKTPESAGTSDLPLLLRSGAELGSHVCSTGQRATLVEVDP